MNIVVEKQPKCVATLRVEIPADRVNGQREQIIQGYARKARISGFRPGKAPRAVVEKRFQKEISDELNGALIDEAYMEAMEQESLKVINFGQPEDLTNHENGSITFFSQMMLAPEIILPEYKNITVKVPLAAVPEEDFEARLKGLQEMHAEFTDIEDRAAAMDDFAVIDYSTTVDGQTIDKYLGKSAGQLGGGVGFWMRIVEEAFLPGFAAQLVGMKPHESREISITLPDDFPFDTLRGKLLVFTTTLKELKAMELPEMNEELASRIGENLTVDRIKDVIRVNLAAERKQKIDTLKVNQLMDQLNKLVDFELPEQLVAQETQNQANTIAQREFKAGISQDDIMMKEGEILANAGQQAVANIGTNFILQEIARVENITVSDQELINALAQIALERKVAPKKFIKDLQRTNRITDIRYSLLNGKTIDFILEHANVEESEETTLDA